VVRAFGHSRETANHEQNAKLEHCQFVIRQPAPLGGVPGRECLYHGLATLSSHWGRSRMPRTRDIGECGNGWELNLP
jgi:hypothetical protein